MAKMLYTINTNHILDLTERNIKRKYENITMDGIDVWQFENCLIKLPEQNCQWFACTSK
jgi:hypothetical protein